MKTIKDYYNRLSREPEFTAYCDENLIVKDIEEIIQLMDDTLNDLFPPISLGELSYDAAEVLKTMDPIAYREELYNYTDELGLIEIDYQVYVDPNHLLEIMEQYEDEKEGNIKRYGVE